MLETVWRCSAGERARTACEEVECRGRCGVRDTRPSPLPRFTAKATDTAATGGELASRNNRDVV